MADCLTQDAGTTEALAWLRDSGVTGVTVTEDGIEHAHFLAVVHSGPEPVDCEAVKALSFRAAAIRKMAILFSTVGFSRVAARWAAVADVGLVSTRVGCSPMPDAQARVIAFQSDEGWQQLLVSLRHLTRAGSMEGVALAGDSSWRIMRLGWREYQLDTDSDGSAPNVRPVRNLRGTPESVLDALRTMVTGPLDDLARFRITGGDW